MCCAANASMCPCGPRKEQFSKFDLKKSSQNPLFVLELTLSDTYAGSKRRGQVWFFLSFLLICFYINR